MTVVMINNSGEERVIMPEIGGEPYTGETVFQVTSRTHNLEPVDLSEDGIWVLPEDSVVTAIISSN